MQDTLEQSHVLHSTSHTSNCLPKKHAVTTKIFFLHITFFIYLSAFQHHIRRQIYPRKKEQNKSGGGGAWITQFKKTLPVLLLKKKKHTTKHIFPQNFYFFLHPKS